MNERTQRPSVARPRLTSLELAHAVRIHGIAKPLNWDVTVAQIENELDIDAATIRRVVAGKGWRIADRKADRADYDGLDEIGDAGTDIMDAFQ